MATHPPPDLLELLRLSPDSLMSRLTGRNIRASGPGGQKVNKTSSAAQLALESLQLQVTCQKYRSLKENKVSALRIMRQEIALLAKDLPDIELINQLKNYFQQGIHVQPKNNDFALVLFTIIGTLAHFGGNHKEAAAHLKVTPSALVKFIGQHKRLLERVNQIREANDHPKLKVR